MRTASQWWAMANICNIEAVVSFFTTIARQASRPLSRTLHLVAQCATLVDVQHCQLVAFGQGEGGDIDVANKMPGSLSVCTNTLWLSHLPGNQTKVLHSPPSIVIGSAPQLSRVSSLLLATCAQT